MPPLKKTTKPAATPAPASAATTKKPAAAPAAAPAPATVKKPAARATSALPKVATPTPPAPAAPAPAAAAPVAAAPFKADANHVTAISARIDVGFGNALYIRGEGPGLTWNKGLPLKNTGADEWTITLPKSTRPIVFKFLLNDETWSTGVDFTAEPGTAVTLSPAF
jgi:hypothetical protein